MKLKFIHFFTLFTLFLMQLVSAQEKTVSGVVSDQAGLPIPGVSIFVKGTKTSTQTDINGKYSLKIEGSKTLVFSYLGMKTQEIEAKASNINVKMSSSEAQNLNEVVVTAFGLKREKKSLGYATQEIKGSDISSGAGSGNFINELSGKAAGVAVRRNNNFGGSANVVSRGIKNLTGDNQMLIVIDGMPINNQNNSSNSPNSKGSSSVGSQNQGASNAYDYGNAGMDINPEDIESVNILKGAAASALYGYQAGNGVLLITTKKGRAKKGVGITISSEVVISGIDKSTFPKYQDKYGAGYGPLYGDGKSYFNTDKQGNLVVPTQQDASYGGRFDPSLMVFQWDAYTPYSSNYGKKTPWVAAKNGPITFLKTPISMNNSISFEDGNEKTGVVVNYTNFKQNGLMPNSELNKNNASAKFNHKFDDQLTISAFANFDAQRTIGRNATGYSGGNIMGTFRQWWQTNVDIQEQKRVFEKSGGQNISWNMTKPEDGKTEPKYFDNPYFTRYKNYQSDERNRFIGYTKLDYKINSWLSASGKISTDTYFDFREERLANGSIPTMFGIGDGITRISQNSGYQRYNLNFSEQNYEAIFTFKKDISKDISFNGLFGGNVLRSRSTTLLTSTQGGLIISDLFSLANSVSLAAAPIESEVNRGVNSTFGSASFGYLDRLFLESTVRRDAFSTLPKGNNTVTTFSVSGSYLFSKDLGLPWLNLGKLRLNYAENPQGMIDDQVLQDVYNKFIVFDGNQLYSVQNTKYNNNLKPVKTRTKEAGLEAQLFNRRLGFDFGIYESLSVDQIFPVATSASSGNSTRYINAGSVRNRGIEVQLNGTPIKANDFQWDVFVNWSLNRNQVMSLVEGTSNLLLGSYQGGVTINATVNEPYGTIKGSDFTYLNGEKIVGTNGRYVINADSGTTIGNITPDWVGGVRNKFTYKDLSLGFLIDVQKGGDIFSLDQYYGQATGLYPQSAGNNDLGNPVRNTLANGGGIVLPGVQADGTPNAIRTPSPEMSGSISGYNFQPAKAYIYDASYVKLREVNVTYSFPKKWVNNMKLVALNLSLVGSNLWIIHKNLPYADPESGYASGNLSYGYSSGSLPTTRNIGCNITVKF